MARGYTLLPLETLFENIEYIDCFVLTISLLASHFDNEAVRFELSNRNINISSSVVILFFRHIIV